MEPFHVTCETCHARLKIRSESVIGQIHACPKCESMVHIVPPLGWVPSTAPAAEPVEGAPVEVPAAAMGSTLLTWSLGAAALVLVVGAFASMWPRGDESDAAPASAPVVAVAAASDTAAAADPPAAELPAANPLDNAPIDDITEAQVADVSSGDSPATEPALSVAKTPPLTGVGVEEIAVAAPAEIKPQVPAASPPAATESGNKKPVLKFDPLDFDPSQLSLGGATSRKANEASASVADASAEPIAVDRADETPADPEPAGPPVGDPSVTVRIGPGATDVLRPRKVAEQLAMKVESLDLAAAPLTRFLSIVSDLSGVPVTIDPAALAMAGVSSRATVDVQARGTTIEKLLHDALAKLRLDIDVRNGHVVVTHPSRDVRRGVDYEVKDLLESGANDATAISEMIQRLVAPDSWRGGASGGSIRVDGTKLHVEHAHHVQIQILMLCERLRLARGLAPRSRYPAERLSIDSPYVKLSARLGKPTTFTFLPWTRLADVVRHWQELTGITILVDWQALAKEELAPATPIACSAINRPWDAAFDAVFEPLGLAWWAVDGETIQITSRSAVGRMERIEFYPAPKDHASGKDAAPEGATHVELDAPSGRVIILASPEVHRNLSGRLSSAAAP